MATDSRGVLRGRCLVCSCNQYTHLVSDKCSGCFHAPAKHTKLDHNSVSPMPSQALAGQSVGFSAAHQPTRTHQQSYHVTPAAVVYTPPVESYSPYSGPFLKDCQARGCFEKVYYDPELGPFDYCSPQCRDRHLLPLEQERLRNDIARNTEKMITYLPSPSTSSSYAGSSGASSTGSTASPADDWKKKRMITIEKKPREPLGIITAQIPNETGYRIVGVELDTPGHRELKKGNIKLLDRITQLNEDNILSREWFEQSTRDKTKPMLTLWRNTKPPNVDKLLSRVKEKGSLATHIRLVMNPFVHHIGSDFGFEPVQTTNLQGAKTGILAGVREDSSAHLSGVTIRDEILMYFLMFCSSKILSEPKFPTSAAAVAIDAKAASTDGKHIILVLRRHKIQC